VNNRRVLRLNHVTFAAEDPLSHAAFWGELLNYETERSGEDCLARGDGPDLLFKRMPKSPTIELPIHLDVNVPDREAEVQRALGLGARLVATKTSEVGELKETYTVMRDPEGIGFCVQGPDPRRPHPYIGNVTFSSAAPRRLGAFWSEALGWPEQIPPDDFLQMLWDAGLDRAEYEAYYATMDPDGTRPRFLFQRREKSRPESYPVHLDFSADDRESEVARLTRAGATVTETKTAAGRVWTILRDPEGNPFCVE
jgi:predicted enzyme related to lactoylglutathione lyase